MSAGAGVVLDTAGTFAVASGSWSGLGGGGLAGAGTDGTDVGIGADGADGADGAGTAGPAPVAKPVAWWPPGAAGDSEAIRMSYPQTSQNRPVAGAWHCGQRVSPGAAAGAAAGVPAPEPAAGAAPAIGAPHTSQ
jgi:hypothetical protein